MFIKPKKAGVRQWEMLMRARQGIPEHAADAFSLEWFVWLFVTRGASGAGRSGGFMPWGRNEARVDHDAD